MRDYARHGSRNFLAKVMRGENPFTPENSEHEVSKRDYLDNPYGHLGAYKAKDLWEITSENAMNFILSTARGVSISNIHLPDDQVMKTGGFSKTVGEYRALWAMPDENQRRETCLSWLRDARSAAANPLNSGVAVPHLAP